MNYTIALAFLSILSLSACSSGSNTDDQVAPSTDQAAAENLVIGLWDFPQIVDEDVESDREVDLYAEYFEITDDSFILYVTDGISNCYEADSFPITNITGNEYSIDFGAAVGLSDSGIQIFNLEATESTLFWSSSTTDGINDGAISESTTDEYARVINFSSQDFNSCTF